MTKKGPESLIWLCRLLSHSLISTGISPWLLLLECTKCSLLMHVRGSFFHLQHLIYRPVVPLILCRAISSAPQIALSKPLLCQIKRKVIAIVWLQIHQCQPPFSVQPQIKGPSCPCAPLITGLGCLCEWTPGLLHFYPQIGFEWEPPVVGVLIEDPHTLLCSAAGPFPTLHPALPQASDWTLESSTFTTGAYVILRNFKVRTVWRGSMNSENNCRLGRCIP